MTDYTTVAKFRAYIKDSSSNDVAVIAQCLDAASRSVEQDCKRFFTQDTTTSIKYFDACDIAHCELADGDMAWDLWTTTDLVVKTDPAGNGTYTDTWTIDTHFVLDPINQAKHGVVGWPYEAIHAIGNRTFPRRSTNLQRPLVQVTGKWGWASVPTSIEQATLLMANAMYKRGDAPFGVAGFDAFGAVRVRNDPMYWQLLSPFIRTSRLVA